MSVELLWVDELLGWFGYAAEVDAGIVWVAMASLKPNETMLHREIDGRYSIHRIWASGEGGVHHGGTGPGLSAYPRSARTWTGTGRTLGRPGDGNG